ncbi:hypothetical protein [Pseudomonas kurunegalensis]|uniref:Uncharacterized protein n=1 Tax=Pseudomonas kurunegalensis TaxID=485880 RepID=A0ACC5UKL3_9PSED|nr:hypothetical protein [Pseudomonas kurunegalensis]MBV4514992.1 hypothetical protein [Pseudomonas kurunegalensis]
MKEDLLVPAIAALFVGLIAGFVSLVVSILSKDQKTSEFRQIWIDGLRDDASNLVAHLAIFKFTVKIVNEKEDEEIEKYIMERQDQFQEVQRLIYRIMLRLNPVEHGVLIETLRALEDTTADKIEGHAKQITLETQEILKMEWERVKRGEPSFVLLKKISKGGIYSVLALGAGVCAAFIAERLGQTGIGW